MRTDYLKVEEVAAQREWYVVDAQEYVLGRLASNIASVLRGKNKPAFAPHQDLGDFVVVINAEKVKLTGKKAEQKTYFRHSGYPGGAKTITFREMIEKHPERVIENAVRLMLPKNTLGRGMLKKLKVYAGENHPHQAQNPKSIKF
ncbi:MAG: 50S ribosomal protein L13 [Calditrichia bacterium]|nr:50S ribosomal protein L13 [Calditrichia bacterium]